MLLKEMILSLRHPTSQLLPIIKKQILYLLGRPMEMDCLKPDNPIVMSLDLMEIPKIALFLLLFSKNIHKASLSALSPSRIWSELLKD